MDLYDVFNQQLNDFISDVTLVYPDMKNVKSMITLAIGLDRTTPAKMFSSMVVQKYGDKIANRDESFFLEYQFKDEVNNMGLGVDLIGNLKSAYQTFETTDKDAVWKHLQVLVLLCKRIGSLPRLGSVGRVV